MKKGIKIYKHKEFPESILVRDFDCHVNMDTMIKSWESIAANNLLSENHVAVLNYMRNCEFDIKFNDFRRLLSYLKSVSIFKKIKIAVLCNNPRTVVFPAYAEYCEREIKMKPFSTEKAAIQWIIQNAA